MIITPERLVDLAQEEIQQRADRQRIVAGYLVGSVVRGEPLLGGCADIDLILIHPTAPLRTREIKRLSHEVHFDIYHKSRDDFENPRELRTDPGLGCSLCGSLRLFDPEHFFDWVQAAACAQFTRPDNRTARARVLLEKSRAGRADLVKGGSHWPRGFIRAAWYGVNALCCLSGKPVHGRRAIAQLRQQLAQLNGMDHFDRFLSLFQAQQMGEWNVPSWLTSFGKAYDFAIQLNHGEMFKPVRRDYYLQAFQELSETGQPEAAVISMLSFWPQPVNEQDPMVQVVTEAKAWQDLLRATGLIETTRNQKLTDLENFLDEVELHLEQWGAEHGA